MAEMAEPANYTEEDFCKKTSEQLREPLYATAPAGVKLWLALEYDLPYGREALEESSLPQDVREYLRDLLAVHPEVRLQFIKKAKEPGKGNSFKSLFVAVPDSEEPALWHFPFHDYPDLMDLKLETVIEKRSGPASQRWESPLILICTNGKRDRCCSRWGIPMYKTFHGKSPDRIWQTSHTGGHRFAPNVIVLPAGVLYGRIRLDEVDRFLANDPQIEITSLEHYRGRASLSRPAQAAEYFIRRENNLLALERLTLVSEQEDDLGWKVTFRDNQRDVRIRVDLREEQDAYQVRASCVDEHPKWISKLRLGAMMNIR